ncbi:membrane protein [Geomonas limicola]|uniref:Membrane protein n=1 Tax=Geomonas limicola TaxID=2740186 RepID=A0A6V8N1T0_9BACT|nr:outer membrane protein transport protein [Geomonas limicola]GFO66456.1 membrane protein [Geomonas limicola]
MICRKSIRWTAPVLALGLALIAANDAKASGFSVFTHGASALGQGNAVTAHTQSPSTIFYNPALMNRLDGTRLELGTTALMVSREYNPAGGGTPTSNDSSFFPSSIYVTHKFNDSLSAGLGIFNPFGLGTEWSDTWAGKYIATKSELTTYNFNPAVSWQVTKDLAVAAGLDVILLDATLQRKLPPSALSLPLVAGDVNSKFKGDGTGIGFNVGIAYDPIQKVTLGVSYRSPVTIDIDGDATFSNPNIPGGHSTVSGKSKVTLPQQLTAAVAYRGTEKLTVEAGLRWEGWSSFDKLQIDLANGGSTTTPRDWKDTWGFNLGGRYQYSDMVALLAGYVYGDAAAPGNTFDPSIPDANTHVFCVGTDVNFNRFNLALSYAYQLYEKRTKSNTISGGLPSPPFSTANGTYETDAHLVALSLGYKF